MPFEEDVIRFVCNAIQPSEVSRVFINEENKAMEVVVPDSQLSLAIGKKGQNVRLATKLTGWQMTIVSESHIATKRTEAIFNLSLLKDMSETMAQNIYQSGFNSFQALADAPLEDVVAIPGYEEKDKAQKLIDDSKALLQKYKDEGKEVPSAPLDETLSSKGKVKQSTKKAKASASELTSSTSASINKLEDKKTTDQVGDQLTEEPLQKVSDVQATSQVNRLETEQTVQSNTGKTASQQAEERLKEELSALKKSTSTDSKDVVKKEEDAQDEQSKTNKTKKSENHKSS